MADITITAASVLKGSNARTTEGVAGATVTAGEVVYKDSDGKYQLADCDASGKKQIDGVALNGASDGQPLEVQVGGSVTIGGTLTAGTAYFLSATAGGVCPAADLTTADDVCLLGIATSTTVLNLHIDNTGVTL